jgi:hypothetical protein
MVVSVPRATDETAGVSLARPLINRFTVCGTVALSLIAIVPPSTSRIAEQGMRTGGDWRAPWI